MGVKKRDHLKVLCVKMITYTTVALKKSLHTSGSVAGSHGWRDRGEEGLIPREFLYDKG